MSRLPFSAFIGTFISLAIWLAIGAVAWSSEEMVHDFALEKRLEVTQWYTTEEGDTLEGISRLVYGHSTWWKKLKILNPKLRSRGPSERLDRGLRVMYRSPKVGTRYTVRKNETLSRIAQWKYGTANAWRGLYAKNRKITDNPNLIHPGDELVFEASGIVRNITRGNQVVARVQTPETPSRDVEPLPEVEPTPVPVPVEDGVAIEPAPPAVAESASPGVPESASPGVSESASQEKQAETRPAWTYWGVLALLFVVVTLFSYLSKRRAILAAQGGTDPLEEVEEPTQPMGIRAFRRKIEHGMQIDRSLLRDDYRADLEENRRPSYHTLVKIWFFKWLKLFGKN